MKSNSKSIRLTRSTKQVRLVTRDGTDLTINKFGIYWGKVGRMLLSLKQARKVLNATAAQVELLKLNAEYNQARQQLLQAQVGLPRPRGYSAEFRNGGLHFGCRRIRPAELQTIDRILRHFNA